MQTGPPPKDRINGEKDERNKKKTCTKSGKPTHYVPLRHQTPVTLIPRKERFEAVLAISSRLHTHRSI